MSLLTFILWLIIGIVNLLNPGEVGKLSYGLCWAVLMINLFIKL